MPYPGPFDLGSLCVGAVVRGVCAVVVLLMAFSPKADS